MDLGVPELLFIFILALIIFGPKKLPEIGKQIGKAITEFKRASNEFKSQLEHEVRQLEESTKSTEPAPAPVVSDYEHEIAEPVITPAEGAVARESTPYAASAAASAENSILPPALPAAETATTEHAEHSA